MPKDLLKWTAAGFALAATATAEYEIAREIGMNEWIAAAVPGALDAYVVRALRSGREVLASVTAMVGVNAASHLVTAGILPVEWPLITAVSAIAPLVLWRVHALGHARHTDVHTSTEGWTRVRDEHGVTVGFETPSTEPEHTEHTEHDRAPDNPEPPGTREHPEVCYCGAEVWGDLGAHQRAPWHPAREHAPERTCDWCGYSYPDLDVPFHKEHACVKRWGHTASTPDLDVPDWVNPPSTPPVPVHAPYADHVLIPSTPSTRHLSLVHAPDPVCPACKHGVHAALACDSAFCDCVHHLPETEHAPDPVCENCGHAGHGEHRHDGRPWADDVLRECPECPCAQELREMCGHCADAEHTSTSTRTADDWNLEHVSTGTLTPEDTEHMERARELFHTIGGVPPFRALKHGTPGMGTDRAKRIRAALELENKGTD